MLDRENYEENKYIVSEIARQIGGARFKLMTGSKMMFMDNMPEPTLRILLGTSRNKLKAKALDIVYNRVPDAYTMIFYKLKITYDSFDFGEKKMRTIKDVQYIEVKRIDEVYCDMLEDVFEQETGLFTSLAPRRDTWEIRTEKRA